MYVNETHSIHSLQSSFAILRRRPILDSSAWRYANLQKKQYNTLAMLTYLHCKCDTSKSAPTLTNVLTPLASRVTKSWRGHCSAEQWNVYRVNRPWLAARASIVNSTAPRVVLVTRKHFLFVGSLVTWLAHCALHDSRLLSCSWSARRRYVPITVSSLGKHISIHRDGDCK